ncbi:uncharacterized protein LOC122936197 [Bufo gargarizans]|uniref:uncharacterized protein LOC122936197 n=1 Tax=Bufo gargarizans TaxID=30331 RepID=UPI001CF482EE|nr:uncharacterized protein LOC122936197 [Bufo gargarizans]
MESIFKEVAKLKDTAAILQAMQGSTDPWLQAQNCVANLISTRKWRKRKGKYALSFAAGWIADKYQESCRLKLSLEEVEDLKVEIVKLRTLVQQAAEASANYECTARCDTELRKENEWLSESLTHAQGAVEELSALCRRTEDEHSRCLVQPESLKQPLMNNVSRIIGNVWAVNMEDCGSDSGSDSRMEMGNVSDPGVGSINTMPEDSSDESVQEIPTPFIRQEIPLIKPDRAHL